MTPSCPYSLKQKKIKRRNEMTKRMICPVNPDHGEIDLAEDCPACIAEKNTAKVGIEGALIEEFTPVTGVTVKINPIANEQVATMLKEATDAAAKAEVFTVNSHHDVELATNDLSIIAGIKKRITAKKKEYIDPLDELKRDITAAFAQLLDPILSADKALRSKVIAFQDAEEARRKEIERINAERQRLAEAEAKLSGGEAEPVEKLPERPEINTTRSDMGTSGRMKIWKWRLVDKTKVPLDYLKLDEGAITKAVKASQGSMDIPGIEIYQESTLQVKGR
jgi:Fe-S cluster biogenesis protein NfuA